MLLKENLEYKKRTGKIWEVDADELDYIYSLEESYHIPYNQLYEYWIRDFKEESNSLLDTFSYKPKSIKEGLDARKSTANIKVGDCIFLPTEPVQKSAHLYAKLDKLPDQTLENSQVDQTICWEGHRAVVVEIKDDLYTLLIKSSNVARCDLLNLSNQAGGNVLSFDEEVFNGNKSDYNAVTADGQLGNVGIIVTNYGLGEKAPRFNTLKLTKRALEAICDTKGIDYSEHKHSCSAEFITTLQKIISKKSTHLLAKNNWIDINCNLVSVSSLATPIAAKVLGYNMVNTKVHSEKGILSLANTKLKELTTKNTHYYILKGFQERLNGTFKVGAETDNFE